MARADLAPMHVMQVRDEARRHFDCPSLLGALAEDGTGIDSADQGTAGASHLENSVFYVRHPMWLGCEGTVPLRVLSPCVHKSTPLRLQH